MPTPRTLNPNAPEYKRLPPGIYPNPDAPLPFSFCPPSSAASPHLPPPAPLCFQNQVVPYIPASIFVAPSQQRPVYHSYHSTYRSTLTPLRKNATNSPLPSAGAWPQPRARESGRRVGGNRGRGRGFRGGRGSGRESYRTVAEGNGRRRMELKVEGRASSEAVNNESGRRRGEIRDRHKVMPLTRGHDQDKTTVMIKNIPYDCPY